MKTILAGVALAAMVSTPALAEFYIVQKIPRPSGARSSSSVRRQTLVS